jgi:Ca-activated chloride channel family protein
MTQETSFKSATGETVALKSVHLSGNLEGLLLSMKVQQRYRNDTGKNLETVYTFPLAWGATLLGLNVEIAGKRLQATVIEKKKATKKYEEAIDDGDTPVMVEQSASGLYTANLGNLKDKEEVTIEIEYAQLLRFEQGQVRICIPTVIAPRFGESHQSGGLAVHETDSVNPMAEYPLTLKLDILGQIARAKLTCPSHKVSTTAIEQGLAVLLESGGMLDRDFTLNLEGLAGHSFAVTAPDGDQKMVLASFCPQLPVHEATPLMMKILVDCSGSMQGDSIEAAKSAIHSILQELNSDDLISYSRFGDDVSHDLSGLRTCTPATVHFVASAISKTEANLGGTELNDALISTFNDIEGPSLAIHKPSVLLITDGDVWDVEAVVKASAEAGQRVFAIGVGSSPAESLLRDLAEKTGGACELVSPNEDISAAIMRMFRRMRGAQAAQLKVEWSGNPDWQSPLPAQIYDGETVHVFARFSEAPQSAPKLTWEIDGQITSSSPESISEVQDPALARLGAAKQMASATSPEESLAIALKYQLVSKQSNLFLVHIRAEEDKAKGLPSLQQIEQMQAAGHSGFGSVAAPRVLYRMNRSTDIQQSMSYDSLAAPSVWRTSRTRSSKIDSMDSGGMDDFEIPAFLRKQPDDEKISPTPEALLNCFNGSAVTSADFSEAIAFVSSLAKNTDIEKLVALIVDDSINNEQAWALLLDWLVTQLGRKFTLERHAQRMLKGQIAAIDENIKTATYKKISGILPSLGLNDWGQINGWSILNRIATKVKGILGRSKDVY